MKNDSSVWSSTETGLELLVMLFEVAAYSPGKVTEKQQCQFTPFTFYGNYEHEKFAYCMCFSRSSRNRAFNHKKALSTYARLGLRKMTDLQYFQLYKQRPKQSTMSHVNINTS